MICQRGIHIFSGHHLTGERLQESERDEFGLGAFEPLADVGEFGFGRECVANGLAGGQTDLEAKCSVNYASFIIKLTICDQ